MPWKRNFTASKTTADGTRDSEGGARFGADKPENRLAMKLKKLEMEAASGSSSNNLSGASSSIRAEDKTKNRVNSPMKKFGETGGSNIIAANLSQQIAISEVDTSTAMRTGDEKLDVSQFKGASRNTPGMIYEPNKSLIPSTVRSPAATSAPNPQRQFTQGAVNQLTPRTSANMKLPKVELDKSCGDLLK